MTWQKIADADLNADFSTQICTCLLLRVTRLINIKFEIQKLKIYFSQNIACLFSLPLVSGLSFELWPVVCLSFCLSVCSSVTRKSWKERSSISLPVKPRSKKYCRLTPVWPDPALSAHSAQCQTNRPFLPRPLEKFWTVHCPSYRRLKFWAVRVARLLRARLPRPHLDSFFRGFCWCWRGSRDSSWKILRPSLRKLFWSTLPPQLVLVLKPPVIWRPKYWNRVKTCYDYSRDSN